MSDKRRVILGLIAAVLAIVMFGVVVHLIEKHGELDEQFGDSGDWAEEKDDEILLTLDGKDYISNDGARAFLLAGTDGGGDDKGEGMNGSLADFIMVLIVDDATGKYGFYPIDRNSITDVSVMDKNGNTSYVKEQLCTAHWYGRTETERNINLADSVTSLLGGLDIDSYYVINMADIGAINDAIGGVDVKIEEDLTSLDPEFKEGTTVHLDGKQAEKYLRARMDVGKGTNAERMKRQQQYMQSAYDMIIGQLRDNPEYVNDLYDQLKGKVETDGNTKDLSVIANKMMQYPSAGFITFDGKHKTGDTLGDGVEHEEFYTNEKSILEGLRKTMYIEEDKEASEDQ